MTTKETGCAAIIFLFIVVALAYFYQRIQDKPIPEGTVSCKCGSDCACCEDDYIKGKKP